MTDDEENAVNDESLAASMVCYELSQMHWDDEIEYAETLRDRRKLYTTLLVVVLGLGIFRIDLYGDPEHVQVVNNFTVGAVRTMIFFALPCFFTAVVHLYGGGTVKKITDYERCRASECFDLPADEVEALHHGKIHPETRLILKTTKLREATELLSESNRKVSENLKFGAAYLLAGYVCLTLALMSYTFSPRIEIVENQSRLKSVEGLADDYSESQAENQDGAQGKGVHRTARAQGAGEGNSHNGSPESQVESRTVQRPEAAHSSRGD